MTAHRSFTRNSALMIAMAFSAGAHAAAIDISTEPLNTYSAPSSTDVKPNIFFVLDDSGSMDWDFMPDWACSSFSLQNSSCSSTGQDPSSERSEFLFRNSSYNGVYYNPAVTYKPPVAVDSTGAVNTSTYPSMTGMSAATGANTAYDLPNWRYVKNDAYGVQSTSRSNLMTDPNNPPYYFTTAAGEYCDAMNLRNCTTSNIATGSYKYPAKLRWCDNTLSNCRAAFSSTFSYARAPSPSVATITVSGSNWSSTSISGMTVNGKQIMAGATTGSTYYSTVAQRIVDQINQCTISMTGNCEERGYHASRSGNVVTIIAPTTVSYAPNIIGQSGPMTLDVTSFSKGSVPGTNLPTVITSDINSYPKATTRTDCAGATCTYVEEMTNYANWWTYYRTRMQMMKTAASNAFATIDAAADIANSVSRFRLGFMSINNNTDGDFLNLGEFKGTQKYNWYTKLINANPGSSTPLRAALSKAGRLYAGKLNGTSLNGSTVADPLQYSCQQNYTILSTDGFWNEGSGYYKMDGSTNVGNQDSGLPTPYYDGGNAQMQARTSQLQSQSVTQQQQISTSSLQQQTTQLQARTSQLQTRTSSNSGSTWTAWTNVSSCSKDTSGSSRRDCRYTSWSDWTGTNSCNAVAQDTSNPYSVGLARQCQTVVISAYTNVSSCTPSSIDINGNQTTCQYTAWTPYANTDSCTAVAQSTSSPYTVGTAARCNTVTNLGGWTNATSCTASSSQNCQYTAWTAWSNVSACTAEARSQSPTYTVGTARECQTLNSGGTSNTLADVAAYYYNTDLRDPDATSGTGTCDGPIIPPATTPTNLCNNNVPKNGRDGAATQHMTTFTLGLGAQGQMIYQGSDYWNDKSGDFFDVLNGNAVDSSRGNCSWQNSGTCVWPTPASNSNANIDDLWHAAINGHGTYFSASDPLSLASSLTSTLSTIANTPRPGTAAAAASSNPNVSASDNYVFSSSYKSVEWYGELIRQRINEDGTLTAQNWSAMKLLDCATTPWTASTSYVAGAVYRQGTACYEVTEDYTSGTTYDSSSGGIDRNKTRVLNVDESATTKVPATAPTSRTIYTKGATGLISFDWTSLDDAGLTSYFTKPAIAYVSGTIGLSQFCATGGGCLSAAQQDNSTIATGGAAGEALVNFLRGDRSNENIYYRKRVHVLGDIVSAEARYVKVPMFNYADAGYSGFKEAKANRAGTVYAASNDGMLHAFDAETGREIWAYIPGLVLPNIYKLADKNYSTQHQYFVDGTPEVGDICPKTPPATCAANEWKTILVGGLNRGGKGYYALDITNPASPSLLWEYTDTNLGYTYGNPKITKLGNGTWVVMFASGYNNADGDGHLYVLNANSGAKIPNSSISTGTGSPSSPSGLARISAHVLQPLTDNTVVAVYGGDVFGNLWRFDVNGNIGADGYDAQLLVSFKDAAGAAQPITVKPLEITINGKPVVYVGTGRYLGTTDVGSTQVQSFYAVKDNLDDTTLGNPRTASTNFVRQTVTSGPCPSGSTLCSPGETVRLGTSNPVDWTTKNGWFLDFLSSGERSVTDPTLGLGTLLFTTVTPNSSAASACGDPNNTSASFAYALDYLTGSAVSGANGAIGVNVGAGLVTRPVMIEQSNGTVRALIRTSGGNTDGSDLGGTIVLTPPIKQSSSGSAKRVSWRELTTSH